MTHYSARPFSRDPGADIAGGRGDTAARPIAPGPHVGHDSPTPHRAFSLSTATAATYENAFTPTHAACAHMAGFSAELSDASGPPLYATAQVPPTIATTGTPHHLHGLFASPAISRSPKVVGHQVSTPSPLSSVVVGSPQHYGYASPLAHGSPFHPSPILRTMHDSTYFSGASYSPPLSLQHSDTASQFDRLSAFGDGLFSPVWQAQSVPSPTKQASPQSAASAAVCGRNESTSSLENEMATATRALQFLDLNPHLNSLTNVPGQKKIATLANEQSIPSHEPTSLLLSGSFESAAFEAAEERVPVSKTAAQPADATQHISRTLWVGNVDPTLHEMELMAIFGKFGAIDSVRLLPDKECAFVNYCSYDSAIEAKKQMQGGRVGSCIVKVGFGKADTIAVPAADSAAALNHQQASRAIWVGNLSPTVSTADLLSVFEPIGAVESLRLLVHKNCGFVNFYRQEDAVRAKQEANGRMMDGWPVRIGFARAPEVAEPVLSDVTSGSQRELIGSQQTENDFTHDPDEDLRSNSAYTFKKEIDPLSAEPHGGNRHLQTELSRLRDIRRRIEHGQVTVNDTDECVGRILPLFEEIATDSFGNTVVQKLIERCSDPARMQIISRCAGKLAAIGIHKNGTWVVQKLVECAKEPAQVENILEELVPYTIALMQDPYGNYVIQGCLRLGPERNNFIFDAICLRNLELGQGKFGARATRACLESPIATKQQQRRSALAVLRNAQLLATNQNGIVLLHWFLDNSNLSGRFFVLASKLLPRLAPLVNQKLAHVVILKLLTQVAEQDASRLVIERGIFRDDDALTAVMYGVGQSVTGSVGDFAVTTVVKALQVCRPQLRSSYVARIRRILSQHNHSTDLASKTGRGQFLPRLLEELNAPAGVSLRPATSVF